MKKYLDFVISKLMLLIVCVTFTTQLAYGKTPKQQIYQVVTYQLKNSGQLQKVNKFLKDAYLPALHKYGIAKVGVFMPLDNDTAAVKLVYVFTPFNSIEQWHGLQNKLENDSVYQTAAKTFFEYPVDNLAYERIESTLLEALTIMPFFIQPKTKATQERVYELRTYESPTESLFQKKLAMFNLAGETKIFERLGFDALFYAKVISGSHMPNLKYMTYYQNLQSRIDH